MNDLTPVSTIMQTDLFTVSPADSLLTVKKIFAEHRFHHLPVVHMKKLVGIISKMHFYKICLELVEDGNALTDEFLESIRVETKMTTKIAKVHPNERIDVAALIFKENLFHALPIVDDEGYLKGLVTPFDIIRNTFKLTQTY